MRAQPSGWELWRSAAWVWAWIWGAVLAASAAETATPPGSAVFASNSILKLELSLGPAEIASLRQTPRKYVPGSLRWGEAAFAKVGVRLKGSTGSFRPIDDKPAFTLDFSEFTPEQRFFGLRKIHLNNSVEDPSFANEMLGGEFFQAAGIPAARAAHALVELNGRELGLYVLKEGFTEQFAALHLSSPGGSFYETDFRSGPNDPLRGPSPSEDRSPTQAVTALKGALGIADPAERWARLSAALEMDRFITFLAVEAMIGHRDGYGAARNNFRIHDNPQTGKLLFLPHGMDQLFDAPEYPWTPELGGTVARAVMETPEGEAQYARRFRALLAQIYDAPHWSNRVLQIVAPLQPHLSAGDFARVQNAARETARRIGLRHASLSQQLTRNSGALAAFTNGTHRPTGWAARDLSPDNEARKIFADGRHLLRIRAGAAGSASWRATVTLPPGRYRFSGLAKTEWAAPLPFGKQQGAALRITGRTADLPGLLGTTEWTLRQADFEVTAAGEEVELICEFRASSGEAWFDAGSLRLTRRD